MYEADSRKWAESTFGGAELGDARRVDRLVDYAASQAAYPTASTNGACLGSSAAAEGAYRLLRNRAVDPTDIDEAVFDATAHQCENRQCVLAIQDTTNTAVKSRHVAQRRDWGSSDGFQVHSTIAVDAVTGEPFGLLDQKRWQRDPNRKTKSQRPKKKRRRYVEKESYKWEAAHRRLISRTKSQDNLIAVSDREADIFEYLAFMTGHNQRFVQRATYDRPLNGSSTNLRDAVAKSMVLATKDVKIQQRGPIATGHLRNRRRGRTGRVANVEIRSATVRIKRPKESEKELPESLSVNVVWVREPKAPKGEKPLDWLLLTSEPVVTPEQVLTVVRHYEKRWIIEKFHQAWKSGCRIEQRAFEHPDNLRRLYAITAPIAMRLLQLQSLQETAPDMSCEAVLSTDEWQCLYAIAHPRSKRPDKPPNLDWAIRSIGRLAGWRDSKRTGRIGWTTIWRGWDLFQQRLIGWKASNSQVKK